MTEHPSLSVARWLREAFQESAKAPEGIEQYLWYWASARSTSASVTLLPDGCITVEPDIEVAVGDVGLKARFGVNTEYRVAVVFWGTGGPTPDLPCDNNNTHLIDILTREGQAILNTGRQLRNRLKRKPPNPFKKQKEEGDEDWGL